MNETKMAVAPVRKEIFAIGILLSLASAWFVGKLLGSGSPNTFLGNLLTGSGIVFTAIPAFISFHISAQACSRNATLKEQIQLYFFGLFFIFFGKYSVNKFNENTKKPRTIQEKMLLKTLQTNSKTEYGRKMGLGNISTVDEYRKRHPLSKYDQFEEYIERMAKGEDNVLLPSRPVQLVLTSGTTGKAKMIPLSAERKMHLVLKGLSVLYGVAEKKIPSKSLTQKMCSVYTHPTEYWSEAGIVKSAFTRFTKKDVLPVFVSPHPAFRICSEKDAMYVHAIFALKDEYLNTIQSPFCTFICNFFKVIENNWKNLVHDISTGTVNADLNIPSDVRSELNAILKPDPIRAEELRQEFELGFDGIAKRVWPHMTFLYGVVSPAFQLYADLLENKYATGVVLYSPFYLASESLFGINLWPTDAAHKYHYVLLPDVTFYEFIPLEKSEEEQPETRLIDELTEGESYELVITNIDGLYRFRFGDVVKVVGFYNNSPIIEIQFRIGDLINLRGEKMSEDCLRRAIYDTVASWEADVVDYTCAECHLVEAAKGATEPAAVPYYVIFVEIQTKSGSSVEEDQLDKEKFDITLRNQVPMYDYYRKMGGLGLAQVIIVLPGSFSDLRNYILQNSTASALQFKMPRKLRKEEWVDVLVHNSSRS